MYAFNNGNSSIEKNETFLEEVQAMPGTIFTYRKTNMSSNNASRKKTYSDQEHPADVFVVLNGIVQLECSIHGAHKIIYDYRGRGELFGDISGHGVYEEDAYPTNKTATVKRIDRKVFVDAGYTERIIEMLGTINRRYRRLREIEVANLELVARVAVVLSDLANRYSSEWRNPLNSRVIIPITQVDLADYINVNRRTLTKVVSEMKITGKLFPTIRNFEFDINTMEEYASEVGS